MPVVFSHIHLFRKLYQYTTNGMVSRTHPDLERAYQLSQEFVMMLSERREADLDTWLTQAEHSGLPEFKKMAKGIRQDYAAVKAAFSSEWSNGQVEAQVNCLGPFREQVDI